MDDARQTFSQETEELLHEMEEALLSLEEEPSSEENLNSVFRAMHTVKGAAGIFGFDDIVAFTHPVETVMDDLRSGNRSIDSDLVAVLLDCKDHTAHLVDFVLHADDGQLLPDNLADRGNEILTALTGNQPDGSTTRIPSEAETEFTGKEQQTRDNWMISLQFEQDALRNGLDPLSFLRYLGTLGTIVEIISLTHQLPPAAEFDPESCYLGFRLAFSSDATKEAIEAVFEFAQDDCDIRILPPSTKQDEYLQLLDNLPEDKLVRLGEILVGVGALTPRELQKALQVQEHETEAKSATPTKRLGEILTQHEVVTSPVVEKALNKQKKTQQRIAQEATFIRVDSSKLGQLINLVGELVISSAAMRVMVERHGITDMEEVVSGVEHLVEEIRDNALQLRMVQIGDTFSRFRRVVRDVSKELNKDIELRITGGETELDKTVVEKINDPLTHLVRNALDHGIETPGERQGKGKESKGTLHLNAYHDSGHIVIQISDDGAGLDPERIREKAIANGMITEDQVLQTDELLRLIFAPGLSTKEKASNLSGRGVGMDVVKRNIEALRGSVELDSKLGKGTTVTIHLPLTLAIIDGFLVGTTNDRYVIPLSMVEECVELNSGEWHIDETRHYLNLRGAILPYLRLSDFFGVSDTGHTTRESLVVVRSGRYRAGFVVDALYGEHQTVIKPLGKVFQNLIGISGATVLGSGDIALILDVQGLINLAHHQANKASSSHAHDHETYEQRATRQH